MKKILLTSIFFLGIGGIVMAQEKQTQKPASATATKKIHARNQEAFYAKQVALKKAKAAKVAAENQTPQQEQSIQKQTGTAATKSKQ